VIPVSSQALAVNKRRQENRGTPGHEALWPACSVPVRGWSTLSMIRTAAPHRVWARMVNCCHAAGCAAGPLVRTLAALSQPVSARPLPFLDAGIRCSRTE